jgi:hypothetical protein
VICLTASPVLEGLTVHVEYSKNVFRNPYEQTIPSVEFDSILDQLFSVRAEDVARRYAGGEYARDSMSFVILDPTAPNSAAAEDIVLVVGCVGPTGMAYAPNAMAKVAAHRDHGIDGGILVYTQNHRLADGSFRAGFSVSIDGTQVGASGQTEAQDRYQATVLAADFNYRVVLARERWATQHGPGRWYAAKEEPPQRFLRALEGPTLGEDRP